MSRAPDRDQLERVSARELVDDALEIVLHRIKLGDIKLECSDELGQVTLECQATAIAQVLMNLLKNSIDALSQLEKGRPRVLRIEATQAGEWIELAVSDSGPGVPPALRKKILDPFFTTKARDKGTGLGLSISRAIVERHGGRLYLDEKSALTRFVLVLPCVARAAADAA
jgi:C4-dicarboxylate-specific signal transduction histidine kinase